MKKKPSLASEVSPLTMMCQFLSRVILPAAYFHVPLGIDLCSDNGYDHKELSITTIDYLIN